MADEVMSPRAMRDRAPVKPQGTGTLSPDVSPHSDQAIGHARRTGDQAETWPLGPGVAMDSGLLAFFEPRFGRSLRDVRLHTGAQADATARNLGAVAFTRGTDIAFRSGYAPSRSPSGGHLLAHELAHVVQATRGGAPGGPAIFRVAAIPRNVARRTKDVIFLGDPVHGILPLTLGGFQDYAAEQADWFVEPSLVAVRAFLWDMLLMLTEGPHIRSGLGDVKLADLMGVVAAPDWVALKAFCRATYTGQPTVRIFRPLPPTLADRTALGRTLVSLEAIIPPAQLEVTVSQSQLKRLQTTAALMPLLNAYWVGFQPFLERAYSPQPGGEGPDFALMLAFLTSIMPGGLAPLMPLAGASPADRWVRNLHRFPLPMLSRLVVNLGETAGTREFVLVLHAGHDAPGAFAKTGSLISALVMNTGGVAMFGPNNLVLMIEGATSLADMTARIPAITATFGKKTGGTRRINQVVIAGHGSGHTIGIAGAGAPVVAGGEVRYPEESLDTSQPNTKALLDALLTRMDPATARVLFFGCLVGSRTVPAGTAAAAIPAALAADQSLAAFTLARAGAAVLPITPGVTVQAARASVATGLVTSLTDPAGRLHPSYLTDPNAYGSATAYAQTGLEPEGVLRAAVEVAVLPPPGGKAAAENMLRTRLAMPPNPDPAVAWYDTITRLMVTQVLPAAAGAGVDLHLLNEAANVAQVPFLVMWPRFGISAAHFVNRLNPQPFAVAVYAGLAATTTYLAPASAEARRLRIIVDQGQFASTHVAATVLSGVLATGLDANAFKDFLDITPAVLGGHEAALLPPGGVPSKERIRLALAWFLRDPANPHVRAFLSAQVVTAPGAVPAFKAATAAEITAAGQSERAILTALGFRLTAAGAPPVGGGAAPPWANVQLPGQAQDTLFVDPAPRVAAVIPAHLNVRAGPSTAHPAFAVLQAGNQVKVVGKTGTWSAIDMNGKLGFVLTSLITP
jgi:hypothetical protein